jgi:hypothetical protein
VNLKNSRADSQITPLKYSKQEIEYQESEKITTPRLGPEMIKSADDVASLIRAEQEQA